ncbi:MAG: hypothetical protein A2469_01240 [Candidatus Magasanikbacteria bacterium RIFOXYC2_FULL_40_16]|uniref:Uncharacterized protein n=3 Tax=Candidatus Magasanikiibacteriota TaxID=1752731 RepID=A0A1F6NF17_9BACT|nr:MAG: hypothetical protein A2224_01330 [Candidatus Magasanikbacteria bacterium RIFOXYA2_FULL_40_20]OGH82440.1 MAG: hypothetical protein A2373_03745 [Candidatus Magasanikbacteria bacterium RIFOXYB1_FULL_40_15]OGH85422.1 MAG: hypothetical protein A2301_02120 [Candidatus Magasanikbacteria bacterium RIFOXYB2_FULL_40_13]OGH87272.1 MAG: hypothetical protein A2206_01595 [Candidatus Magasanikbacteria bacterium RIFOXYA1_FULL_40_8]OGH90385.1 MAG: hypothetical protein A2469_01240 [Candidatus Magasanikba
MIFFFLRALKNSILQNVRVYAMFQYRILAGGYAIVFVLTFVRGKISYSRLLGEVSLRPTGGSHRPLRKIS